MSYLIAIGNGLALGWSKNEQKSCFPIFMTLWLSSRAMLQTSAIFIFVTRTMMTLENTIFILFYFTLCYPLRTLWKRSIASAILNSRSEPDEDSSTTFLVYYLISDYRRGMTLEDGKLAQISFSTRIWKQTNLLCITVAISNDLSGTSKASVPDPVIDTVQENCNASSINVFVLE